jgi:hypothetical protein
MRIQQTPCSTPFDTYHIINKKPQIANFTPQGRRLLIIYKYFLGVDFFFL